MDWNKAQRKIIILLFIQTVMIIMQIYTKDIPLQIHLNPHSSSQDNQN